MSQDQLEIINRSGEVTFYTLEPTQGITNIGRHPDNDIVLDSPGVGFFHAILDHRSLPYQIIQLSTESTTLLEGVSVSPNTPTPIQNWARLEIAEYTLILLTDKAPPRPIPTEQPASEAEQAPVAQPGAAPLATTPSPPPASEIQEREATPVPATAYRLPTRLPDQIDDYILVEITENEWEIAVEETITTVLTVTNGGALVATFEAQVEGIDPAWVKIEPAQVYLHEEEEASFVISITPPRHSASRAGIYPLAISVTSSNYAGHVSRLGGSLTLAPFKEFIVSELSPKRQSLPWRQRYAEAGFTIKNKGNREETFRIEGLDDERACSFEFLVYEGEEAVGRARQTQVTVTPNEAVTVPMRVTPLSRPLYGLRGKSHSVTVNITTLTGEETPYTIMGQLVNRPLIGPLHVAFIILVFIVTAILVTKPRIRQFTVEPSTGLVEAGDNVLLKWDVSPFATDLNIEGVEKEISGASGEISVSPPTTEKLSYIKYRLIANNFLSRFLKNNLFPLKDTRELTILVVPGVPKIETVTIDHTDIALGDSATINWSVKNADEVLLKVGNKVESIPPEEHMGERTLTPEATTLIVLEARNPSGSEIKSAMLWVNDPIIEKFTVTPSEITAGETVLINWDVYNVDAVQISPLPDTYPSTGQVTHQPQETTFYVLTIKAGESEIREIASVTVNPAPITATMETEPPAIEFFTATPNEVVGEGEAKVQLAWSVTGKVTNVEISSMDSFTGTKLKAKDIVTVSLNHTTAFIVTAHNGPLNASQMVEVKFPDLDTGAETKKEQEEEEKEAEKEAEAASLPEIVFFKLEGEEGYEQNVNFERQDENDDGPVYVYSVVKNSNVMLSWETKNATEVSINSENQPVTGETERVIVDGVTYHLRAKNDLTKVHAFVQVHVVRGANQRPQAVDDIVLTNEDTPVIIKVLNNDSDPDGDPLTIISVTPPSQGSATTNGNTITYTPVRGFTGVDVFTYTISDPGNLNSTARVTVSVGAVNHAPRAVNDNAMTAQDTPVTVAVLNNDSDSDGDTLTVIAVGPPASGGTRTDGNTVTYTPLRGFSGTDSFTYTISDPKGLTAVAMVNVTVTVVMRSQHQSSNAVSNLRLTNKVQLNNNSVPEGKTPLVTIVAPPTQRNVASNGTTDIYTPQPRLLGLASRLKEHYKYFKRLCPT